MTSSPHGIECAVVATESLAGLFADIPVVAYEVVGRGQSAWLLPAESAAIAGAVEERRREFAAGRACARAALSSLRFETSPLLIGADRQPIWPAGAMGTISHTSGYCVAVAIRSAALPDATNIGIDVELRGRLTPDLYDQILTPSEQAVVSGMSGDRASDLATMIFTAKEAYYKAQFPLTGRWIGFTDVRYRLEDQTRLQRTNKEDPFIAGWLEPATHDDALGELRWPQPVCSIIRSDRVLTSAVVHAVTASRGRTR